MKKLDGIGEIVSWDSPTKVDIDVFREAMSKAGLDPKVARDVCPANAFRRAVHEMEKNRVIRQVYSDKERMTFQFTSEHLNGTEYEYAKECVVRLNKTSGRLSCEDAAIELMAKRLIGEKTRYRYAADVTRTIKKLFDEHGDLFSLRSAGGVYFVPQQHTGLCDQVESAMKAIGGSLNRWEQGHSSRNKSNASKAIKTTIANLINEAEDCVDGIEKKDDKAMSQHMDRVNIVRLKIESYRDILAHHVDGLEKSLGKVNSKLLTSFGLSIPDPAPQEVAVYRSLEEKPDPVPAPVPTPGCKKTLTNILQDQVLTNIIQDHQDQVKLVGIEEVVLQIRESEEEKPDPVPTPTPKATMISKEEIRRQFAKAGL